MTMFDIGWRPMRLFSRQDSWSANQAVKRGMPKDLMKMGRMMTNLDREGPQLVDHDADATDRYVEFLAERVRVNGRLI